MKKTICCVIVALMLFVSAFSIQSFAAAKELIDFADVVMNINADGTVNVTEKWTVTYLSASDCFYRNIDIYSTENGMSLLQKYDEVKDVSVKIDGKAVPMSENGINTYSVSTAEDALSYEIAINCPSAQITREYEISYTLTQAVKKSGGNAVFANMVIGKTFIYTSNNVTATVVFPKGTEKIELPEGSEGIVDGNKVTFTSKRVFDTFAVEVTADDSIFDNGALASYSAAAENINKLTSAVTNVLPVIIAVVAAVIIILLVLFPEKLIRFSVEKKAKALLKSDENVLKENISDELTACQAYKMLVPASRISPKSASKKVPALFAMTVLECMEKGYIIPDGKDLVVGTPRDDAPAYMLSVLNFLKTFSKKKGNKFIIDETFAENVKSECMGRYDVMTNYLATFYSLIPGVSMKFFRNEKNKELYENAYVVKANAAKNKHKPCFAQCMGDVLSGKKTRNASVFGMLCSSVSHEKLFAKGGRTGEAALCEAIDAMYNVYIKSK